jgi:hypothetical protein
LVLVALKTTANDQFPKTHSAARRSRNRRAYPAERPGQ